MGTKIYDFVVEGARVSGSLIAKLLAEKGGYKIAVCDPTFGEKPGYPPSLEHTKEKPCGGIVDREVIEKFKIPEIAKYKNREYLVIDTVIKRYKFVSPDSEIVLEYLPKRGDAVVRRRNFDWYNFEPLLYMDKNVDFYPYSIEHVEETVDGFVNTLGNDQKIMSMGEVGAGGVSSRVRKDIFWTVDEDQFCTVMVNFLHFSKEKVKNELKDTAFFWFPKQLGYGYGFVIPGSDYVRVGAGQKRMKDQPPELLPECYNELLNHPIFKKKLGNPIEIKSFTHSCPFGKSINFYKTHPACGFTPLSKIKRLANRKVLLGEAAFHNNYLTFEGNKFSMLDAQLVWDCWSRDNSFENFDSEWRKLHGMEIVKPQYQIEDFYDKNKLNEFFRLVKETGRHDAFVLAFKGHIYVPEPGTVRQVIEASNMEQKI